jgi:hypothetical protein
LKAVTDAGEVILDRNGALLVRFGSPDGAIDP